MKNIAAWILGVSLSGLAFGQAAIIAVGTPLNIIDTQKSVVVQTAKGPVTITRTMTACAKTAATCSLWCPCPVCTPWVKLKSSKP